MKRFAPGRREVFGIALALFGFGVGGPLPASAAPSAIEPIKRLSEGLLRIMHQGRDTSFNKRYQTLAPIVEKTFDLQAVLEESVGPTWSTLTKDQQTLLLDAFRRYTVSSYVNSFDNFSGQKIDVSPTTRALANGEEVVDTKIVPSSGTSHALDYVMRKVDGDWRAVDVLADGSISRVAVQRSDFRRLLKKGGPTALAKQLRTKSADLSEGTA